jgi:chromosome segregation ATPase
MRHSHTKHATQLREVQAAAEGAASQAAALAQQLEATTTELAFARSQASEQASRLSHLESEFEALQEVMGEGEQRDIVGRLLSRISSLQAAAVTAEATRRTLHNQMVELRGNVSSTHVASPRRCWRGGCAGC